MSPIPNTITVLVTGVGAIIGQGIIKSLRQSKYPVKVVGIDRNKNSPGSFLCDVFHRKPDSEGVDSGYLTFWRTILESEGVDIVMPGLEVDMLFLDRHRDFFANYAVSVVLNRAELIEISSDKWMQGEQIQYAGLKKIPTALTKDWGEAVSCLGHPPLLLKPRDGNGSRGIVRLHNEFDFDYWKIKSGKNWMLQKIVGNELSEYTVGVFGLGDGTSVGSITFKRLLSSAGNTLQAEVVSDFSIDCAIEKLTKYFRPLGPTNYQFRKDGEEVFLLEINPRFSSSNSLRAAFGYNEAEMSIDFFLRKKSPEMPIIKTGIGWRYSEDFVKYDGRTL